MMEKRSNRKTRSRNLPRRPGKKRPRPGKLRHQKLEERNLLAADLAPLPPAFETHPPSTQTSLQRSVQENHSGHRQDNRSSDRQQRQRLEKDHRTKTGRSDDGDRAIEVRSIDGTGNHLTNEELGSTGSQLLRASEPAYADGIAAPAGQDRVSARIISNELAAQTTTDPNDRALTDLAWLFGQFIDHDIDLSEPAETDESFAIEVPQGDPFFDPFSTGEVEIDLSRSIYDEATGDAIDNPRQQINQISAFLDGSVIYGSDETRADTLRTFSGGLLATSEGDFLPFNTEGHENAGGTAETLFLAGDIRANENVALSAMHTIWVREHNWHAERLAAKDPTLTDEALFQAARSIVTAELQAITYNEFLPALLGENAIDAWDGYDSSVDPGINNVFSTAAFRFGHTMLPTELLRLESDLTTADEGNLSLQNAFFSPEELTANGVESILLGASVQLANEIDNQVVDDVRNFLFGPPGAGGFDLVSLNIQRGRDHGLTDYNQVREDFGLTRATTFADISSDPEVAAKLEQLYGDVDNIDVWVGGLAEDHAEGSSLGTLFSTIIADQFQRIRDGDRLWYQNVFNGRELKSIENTTLADVIERNSTIDSLQDNVFFSADQQPEQKPELHRRPGVNNEITEPVTNHRSDQRNHHRSPEAIDSVFEDMFGERKRQRNRLGGRR